MSGRLSTYLYGGPRYRVVGPLVIVMAPGADGRWTNHYVYADGILPAGVGDEHISELLTAKLIRPVEEVGL